MPQRLDDRAAVGLVLDENVHRLREQSPDRANGLHRSREVHVPVEAVSQIVESASLAPDFDCHEVVAFLVLEGRVHRDDRRAEARDVAGAVHLPPLALDDVAALHARGALIQRLPRAQAALLRVAQIARLELLQPGVVFTELRAERIAHAAAQEIQLLGLDRQPYLLHVWLHTQEPCSQVVLVPRCHDDDDLRTSGKSGLESVLPLGPQLAAVGLAIRLLAVLDGVVDDEQVGRVARDAGHHAA